jgi:hypothetical protein
MQIARGVIGAILLLLGRELNFLFAAVMAAFIAIRLAPGLPSQWPGYYTYIFIGLLALVAAIVALINKRAGYFLSGFLAGGYFIAEYLAPGASTLPLLPFIGAGILGSLILGLLTEWAMIFISSAVGAYYVTTLFVFPSMTKILVGAGLFLIGSITQVIIMRMQKD